MPDTRLAKLFVGSLRREARRLALDAAIDSGAFAMRPSGLGAGSTWMPSPCPDLADAWTILRTGRAVGVDDTLAKQHMSEEDLTFGSLVVPDHEAEGVEAPRSTAKERSKGRRAGKTATSSRASRMALPAAPSLVEREALVRAARDRALPLQPSRIAALLLLAQAVNASSLGLEGVLAILRQAMPVIGMVAPVTGARHLLESLLFAGILPRIGLVPVRTGIGRALPRGGVQREVAVIADRQARSGRWGREEEAEIEGERQRELAEALNSGRPVLALVRSPDDLSPRFGDVADVVLHTGPVTPLLVLQVVAAARGEELPGEYGLANCHLDAELCSVLTLADFDLAIRPGRSREVIASDLMRYAASNASAMKERAEREAAEKRGKAKGQSSNKAFDKHASGSTLVQPSSDLAAPHLDRLAGFGAAVAWAKALEADLASWRENKVDWADLSSKILLHGPPGTGKTLYARALSNTLQIPLFVSSVSTWLESGHLGDVLRRMRTAFIESENNAPCILFLDELDGIGSRETQSGKEYDDYWIAVINSLLTLLDGTAKSQGVIIVGATNRPTAIDPAILRSGRLETHIRVDRPDTAALAGILRVQIASDLGSVAASAPSRGENSIGTQQACLAEPGRVSGELGAAPAANNREGWGDSEEEGADDATPGMQP